MARKDVTLVHNESGFNTTKIFNLWFQKVFLSYIEQIRYKLFGNKSAKKWAVLIFDGLKSHDCETINAFAAKHYVRIDLECIWNEKGQSRGVLIKAEQIIQNHQEKKIYNELTEKTKKRIKLQLDEKKEFLVNETQIAVESLEICSLCNQNKTRNTYFC